MGKPDELGAIDFGIIVDGAVIIVEASVFLMGSYIFKKKALKEEDRDTIAANASKKMMNAAFFGQLIILIVFLPILALEGVEGKMFQPMALNIHICYDRGNDSVPDLCAYDVCTVFKTTQDRKKILGRPFCALGAT